MRSKKIWVSIAVACVSAVAVSAFAVAVVSAQDSEDGDSKQSFVDRVARILGLESERVEDAFDQAHDEMRQERVADIEEKLDAMVEEGELTEEERAEKLEALEDSPKSFGRGHWGRGKHRYWFKRLDGDHDSDEIEGIFRFGRRHAFEDDEWEELIPADGDGKYSFDFSGDFPGDFSGDFSGHGDLDSLIDRMVEEGLMSSERADSLREMMEQFESGDWDRGSKFHFGHGFRRFGDRWDFEWEFDEKESDEDADNTNTSFVEFRS